MQMEKIFKGKIELSGKLECITGLHIGASKETMEIGALDAPVVRDPKTNEPYIPGSSMKGKLRSLLERANPDLPLNRNGGTVKNPIWRHECDDWEQKDKSPGALNCPVCRLFGSTGNKNYPSRLKIRDLPLANKEELEKMDTGLFLTEWKFENSIDRITSAANPRNIERVPKGAQFSFSIIYDVEDLETLEEDLNNLLLAIKLLHDDSLGGHGSRGYGQVKMDFEQIEARYVDYYKGKPEKKETKNDLSETSIRELVEFFKNQGG
jgi:CRISPR-associated protein Csm3